MLRSGFVLSGCGRDRILSSPLETIGARSRFQVRGARATESGLAWRTIHQGDSFGKGLCPGAGCQEGVCQGPLPCLMAPGRHWDRSEP